MESVAFFIIAISFGLTLAIPLVLLGIFLHRVRFLRHSWKLILVRVLCAVIVWTCLSVLMLFFNFAFIYSSAHVPPELRGVAVRPFLSLFTATLVYGLAGWGLCHWVAQARHVTAFDLGLT